MNNYYFTFGYGQVNHGKYVVIQAVSENEARERMFELFSDKWAFQYSEKEWFNDKGESQAQIYGYKELKLS